VILTVTGDDGYGGITIETATVEVANTPPTGATAEFDSSTGKLGRDVVCDIVSPSTDVDGDTLTYTFEFHYLGGTKFTGTAKTSTYAGDTLPSDAVRLGEQVQCRAWVSDGTVTVGPTSDSVTFTDCGPIPTMSFGGAKDAQAVHEFNGRCFYLGDQGGTCDQTCTSVGGANRASEGMSALSTTCRAPRTGNPADHFRTNGNSGQWGSPNTSTHSFKSLGHGRVSGRAYGACSTGTTVIGTYPSESNSDSQRSLVCACF